MSLQFDPKLQIEQALKAQNGAWTKLLASVNLEAANLVATTISLKVADKAALFELLETNAADIDQAHIGTVNDRYIASAVLRQPYQVFTILKIIERRPGSTDPLGLDSIDYLVPDIDVSFEQFKANGQPILRQRNDMHEWLSLRFGPNQQFESKCTDTLVIDVAIKEMEQSSQRLRELS